MTLYLVCEAVPECPVHVRGAYTSEEAALSRRDTIEHLEDPYWEVLVVPVKVDEEDTVTIHFADIRNEATDSLRRRR